VFPYDLGLSGNLREFYRQCVDIDFEGTTWAVAAGSSHRAFVNERNTQKAMYRARGQLKVVARPQPWTALNVGVRAALCAPGCGEPKLNTRVGDVVLVLSQSDGWGYGELVSRQPSGTVVADDADDIPVAEREKGERSRCHVRVCVCVCVCVCVL
jgi:hypothetical protein